MALQFNGASIRLGNNMLSIFDGQLKLSGSSAGFNTGSNAGHVGAGTIKLELTGTLPQVVSQSGGVDQYRFGSASPDQRVFLQQPCMRISSGSYQIFLESNYAKLITCVVSMDDTSSDVKLSNVRVVHDPAGDNFLLDGLKSGSLPNGNVGGQNAGLAYSTVGIKILSGSTVAGVYSEVAIDPTGSLPRINLHIAVTKDGTVRGL